MLWTRVSGAAGDTVPVRWTVASDAALATPVAGGSSAATPDGDHTVHVAVSGLRPATTYWYGFSVGEHRSPVGRTRTLPAADDPAADRLRLGVVCCAHYATGWFNAYGRLAERDVDLVVHLGDYIYEAEAKREKWTRFHRPRGRCLTLPDYRARHGQYKTDPDLQELHRRHPMVAVWDDHDVAGNAWRDGAVDHDPDRDGDWYERRAAAMRAYLEWLPVRPPDVGHAERIYRSFSFGDLAELTVLDTRLIGRDRPAGDGERAVATVNRQRSLLGDDQWKWLRGRIGSSSSRWQLVTSQVMMAPLRALDVPEALEPLVPGLVAGGVGVNGGQWDGYPHERARLFDLWTTAGARNVVVLSGDLHSSWASELAVDPEAPSPPVGIEFVAPSVTSRSFAEEVGPSFPGKGTLLRRLVAGQNPHFRFFDLEGHGYVVVDLTRERLEAEFWHVPTVAERRNGEQMVAAAVVHDGETRLRLGPADAASGDHGAAALS